MNPSLVVEEVTVKFGNVVVLEGVSLEVESKCLSGLIGPNGAGKTTLFDVITGFVRPQKGRVILNGRDITHMDPVRRARLRIRRSFQSVELFSDLTVVDNLRVAMPKHSTASVHDILKQLEIEDYANVRAELVPSGIQRVVGFARCLAGDPSILLLDEPGAGMHAEEISQLAEKMRNLLNESELAILVVDHDMDLIEAACDSVTVLDFGKVIANGSPSEIRQMAVVMEAYLGVA